MKRTISNETKAAADHVVGNGGELHQVAGGTHPPMSSQRGLIIADDENSLKAGARGPDLLEDFFQIEKTQHFDHERIPERVVHARGYGAKGFFELTDLARRKFQSGSAHSGRREDAGVCAVLDGGREYGVNGPGTRCARICGEVLYAGR